MFAPACIAVVTPSVGTTRIVRDVLLRFERRAEHYMGMPAITEHRWTASEVRQLIADNPLHTPRYEMVDGELLVTPSPAYRHQAAVRAMFRALDSYVQRHGLGETFCSPSDVELEAESVLQPDVYVEPPEESRRRTFPLRSLLLAVEIVSPSSARIDRGRKRRYYQRNGVPEYWIVDLDSRLVERWRPLDDRPEIATDTLEWRPAGATEPLVIDLRAMFVEAIGD